MSRAKVIFVFGSNLKGIHGAGAALDAKRYFGAEQGVGHGPMGRSYAIPTCSVPGSPLPFSRIADHVDLFLAYALAHPELTFLVTKVGCGYAGYEEHEMAALFRHMPLNVCLPEGWEASPSQEPA